jgi:uncharacterized protein YjbI with pentapeptide repeats
MRKILIKKVIIMRNMNPIVDKTVQNAAEIILVASIYAKTQKTIQNPTDKFENVQDKNSVSDALSVIQQCIIDTREAYKKIAGKEKLSFIEEASINTQVKNLLEANKDTCIGETQENPVLNVKQIAILLDPKIIAANAIEFDKNTVRKQLDSEFNGLEGKCKLALKLFEDGNGRQRDLREKSEALIVQFDAIIDITKSLDSLKNNEIKEEYKAKVETFLKKLPFLLGLDTVSNQMSINNTLESFKDERKAKRVNEANGEAVMAEIDAKFNNYSALLQKLSRFGSLAGANLSGLDLSGFDFHGVNLSNTDLSGCNLTGANLTGAILNGTKLYNANLTKANLTNAKVVAADFACANFTGAITTGVRFDMASDLRGINFTGVDLSGSNFSRINLEKAIFTNCDLSNVNFSNTNLNNATFITNCNLFEANFSNSTLTNATLKNSILVGTNFSNANLNNANLYGSIVTNANVKDADLSGTSFRRCKNITGVKLCEAANLTRIDLQKLNLTTQNFAGCNLPGANLAQSSLKRNDLTGTNLTNAKLNFTNFTLSELENANLSNTQCTGADFNGANLNMATIYGTKGLNLNTALDTVYVMTQKGAVPIETLHIHVLIDEKTKPTNVAKPENFSDKFSRKKSNPSAPARPKNTSYQDQIKDEKNKNKNNSRERRGS